MLLLVVTVGPSWFHYLYVLVYSFNLPLCEPCRFQERTHSLWPHLWENRAEYTNPLYRTDHSQTQGVLKPLTTAYCFK